MAAILMNKKFLFFVFLLVISCTYSFNFAQGALTPVLTEYPTGLSATDVSPTQINLSWTAPTHNYGKTIIGYKIEQEVGYGVYNTLVYNTGTTITAYSVTALKTGATYTYRVSAVYSDDTSSSASNSATATPTITSKAPPSTTIPGSTLQNTQFDFVPPDGTTLSGVIMSSGDYLSLQYKKDARAVLQNAVPTAYPANNNLSNLLAYQANHLSPDSVPTPLIAKAMSDKEILLTWLPPLEQYGQKLLGYKIEVKNSQGVFQSIDDNTGNGDTKYYVTGLAPSTTYTYHVSAVYPATHSNTSNEATATTLVPVVPTPKPNQTTTTTPQPSIQPQTTPPQTVNNVKFDLTAPDGMLLAGVVATQGDYQQFVLIKDPRTLLSNVNTTSFPINNDLAGLIRYQNLHPMQQQSTSPPTLPENSSQPVQSTPPPPDTSKSSDSRLFDGVLTSVVASGVVGIITWFVKTKIARKIAKDYHFTLEYVSSGTPLIRIRNSGETIEDCVILCDRYACVWVDTKLDKPRHVYEGSVSSALLPDQYDTRNPLISVKSGKKILRKINLDEMAHG